MSNAQTSVDADESEVIEALKARGSDSASVDYLVTHSEINSREQAQVALRKLVNQGKVSQTPDWEYKLATRLR
jgi:hypothetical protein